MKPPYSSHRPFFVPTRPLSSEGRLLTRAGGVEPSPFLAFLGATEGVLQGLHGFLLHVGEHALVRVQGDGDRGVP